MILQVAPYPTQIGDDIDPHRTQLVGGSDAGPQQHRWRRDRTTGDDHLAGADGYEFTASFLAWAAQQPVSGAGALGPVEAYGVARLEEGCRVAGLERVR